MNSLKVSEKTHSHSSFSSENPFTLHMYQCTNVPFLLITISIDHILYVENISLNKSVRKDTFILTSKFFLWKHLHMYHIYWVLTFFVVENLESVRKKTFTSTKKFHWRHIHTYVPYLLITIVLIKLLMLKILKEILINRGECAYRVTIEM